MISLTALLIIQTVLCALRGIGFIFMPAKLWATFKIPLNPATSIPAQILGTAYIATAVMNIQTLKWIDFAPADSTILFNFIFEVLGAAVTWYCIFRKSLDKLGWIPFAVHSLLAIGFGYFLVSYK